MRTKKGEAGYIHSRKLQVLLKTILEFGIVIALLVLGIVQSGSRMNVLTIVAILGCLPASKALVELIMILPHKSITKEMAAEIDLNAEGITRAYDIVLTSEKKIMPLDCVVISNNMICGYTSSQKVDVPFAAQHIKQYLYANQFTNVSVKIFNDYTAFITRAEGLNNMAMVEKADCKEQEMAIRQVILSLSL